LSNEASNASVAPAEITCRNAGDPGWIELTSQLVVDSCNQTKIAARSARIAVFSTEE
jgi:hypothetical protein